MNQVPNLLTIIKNQFIQAPVFILGLQKSGTSLLNRLLLKQSEYFFSPFKLEGRTFWGDDPPFSPQQSPCGRIYQNHDGLVGHQVTIEDFNQSDQNHLSCEVNQLKFIAPIWINKNPYNTMRVDWLKAMFPSCFIVAVIRKPEANVFSLKKKFIPHENRGLGPENGWWGVKPPGWKSLKNKNITIQLAKQWKAINQNLLTHRLDIDILVDYEEICKYPSNLINLILKHYDIQAQIEMESIPDMNYEYKQGSRLLSKNRVYQSSGGELDLGQKVEEHSIEIEKLSVVEKFHIKRICQRTWNKCLKLRTRL